MVSVMKIKEAIVLRFKQICDERHMKYNELAIISGVTPSTVYSMVDPNRKDVSVITVKRLCDGLEMSMGEFFSGDVFKQVDQEIE